MQIGITGTRKGMTPQQRETLRAFLSVVRKYDLHEGAAPGVDDEVFQIAMAMEQTVHVYPATGVRNLGSFHALYEKAIMHDSAPPLERNKFIVAESRLLIVVPETAGEVLRSGTWACARYARKVKRELRIIEPDGVVRTQI